MNAYPIDPADLRAALGTCMKSAELQALFKGAPEGAKPVLKVLFCAAVFPEKVSEECLWANLKAMEADLDDADLTYLIENWEGEEFRKYFSDIRSSRNAPKAKIGVIRKNDDAVQVDLNAEAMKRRMEMEEAEEKMFNDAQAAVRRKAARDLLVRRAIVFSLAGCLAAAGCALFWNMQRKRAIREKAEMAKLEAERAGWESERAKEKALREQEREKLRKEREAAAEKRRLAAQERDARNKAAREARERELAECREAEEVKKGYREKYQSVKSCFKGAVLVPWKQLAPSARPGTVDGVFSCVVPEENWRYEIYEVTSKSSGEIKVSRLRYEAAPEEVDFAAWQDKLKKNGGVVGDGRKMYLFAPQSDGPTGLPTTSVVCPSKIRLGIVCDLVTTFSMDMSGFGFAADIRAKGCKKSVSFDPVGFEKTLGRYDIERRIAAAAEASVRKPKPRKIRRTVKMYDGKIIKKHMNGVILVPVNPVHFDSRYAELRAEAERQEYMDGKVSDEDMERYNAEVSKKVQEAFASAVIEVSIKYNTPVP
jgi:hypothetical protein